MNNHVKMTSARKTEHASFIIRASSLIRHWSFVIRHFDHER
jgi:hypothetical protein